jgi:CRISPR-associated endonuclease Csn1
MDHRRLQELARLEQSRATERDGEIMIDPWSGFRDDVKSLIGDIVVSHRPRRKVAGALHEDTIYGPTPESGVFVVRKPLEALTGAMIDDIRDASIKNIVIDRLTKHGLEYGRGKTAAIPKEVWREPLVMPSGVPIRRVRVLKSDLTVRPIRQGSACVKPGAIHHVCIFEHSSNGRVTRDGVFVTMLEAARRTREKEPLVQPCHPSDPAAKFLMTLATGDTLLAELNGKERLVLVSTLVSTQQRIHLVSANDARRSGDKSDVGKTPNSLKARKVTVDPLGRVRWSNDWVNYAQTHNT